MSTKLSDIKTQFPEWYQEVIEAAELADYGPARGTMVIRPYGYAVWENIQRILDKKIKATGTQNAYFPLFIPESFLKKEAEHIEGFSPELAVVTYAGGEELEEPLVVRPTSETIIYHMFSKWIKSWRDLPLKLNQWANVVRWEKRTRLFLRTTEFLWQEGHTAHESLQEANDLALFMQQLYKDFIEHYLAIPILTGEKPQSERFAGAAHTYTFEGIMQDGKALQMGTSHVLLQSFSEAFDIFFQDKEGVMKSPFCTSWAITTRLIGALIMTHGDQRGLIIPPRIAPIQVVIIPIFKTEEEKSRVLLNALQLQKELQEKDIEVFIDTDERKTPGAKFFHWEVRGVPMRIEMGPRDIENNTLVCINRLEEDREKRKKVVPRPQAVEEVALLLEYIQKSLFERALKRQQEQWKQGDELATFGPLLEKEAGFYQTGWCGKDSCEERFKFYKATIRCVVPDKKHESCSVCHEKSAGDIILAKAY